MFLNVRSEHIDAFLRCEVDNFNTFLSQPINAAGKVNGFANDHHADPELQNKTTAIPARRQRGYHYFVAIATLSARLPKSVRLAMHRRVVLLDSTIVAGAE